MGLVLGVPDLSPGPGGDPLASTTAGMCPGGAPALSNAVCVSLGTYYQTLGVGGNSAYCTELAAHVQ